MMSEDEGENEQKLTYFKLIERVESKGCYQWIIYFLVLAFWMIYGFSNAMIAFIFMNPGFDCTTLNIPKVDCQEHICSNINKEDWHKYEGQIQFQSLITTFGPFHCQQNYGIGFMRSIMMIGLVVGSITLIMCQKNSSYRKAILIELVLYISGHLILMLSQSLTVACIGLFIIGLGFSFLYRLGISIISEITEKNLAQKFIATLYGASVLASILCGVAYGSIKHWRNISLYLCLIPGVLLLILTYIFLQDAPKYLLKTKDPEKICKALNYIGYINKGEKDMIKEEEIVQFLEEQKKYEKVKQFESFFDLFRFESLRLPSIIFFSIIFILDIMAYSYYVILNQFGINPILNEILLCLAEGLGVFVSYFIISKVPRQLSGKITFFLIFVNNIILLFLIVPNNCDECYQVIIQLILMMSCTFGIGLQFSIFYVSQAQFYPVSIKYIAFGFGSIIEGISIAVPQLLMIDTGELGINPFLIVSLLAIGLFGLYFFVPETLNMKERDQIEEIESIKQKSD